MIRMTKSIGIKLTLVFLLFTFINIIFIFFISFENQTDLFGSHTYYKTLDLIRNLESEIVKLRNDQIGMKDQPEDPVFTDFRKKMPSDTKLFIYNHDMELLNQ
jgi:hypothetical protein